ncbi:hypothetical protein, partial [Altererythrobacter sp. C41]|uniref:hypothetical protein n=1 Tax=Altererythrobacter sp. C41 TaxID=2806021 RepID=UPI001EE497C0
KSNGLLRYALRAPLRSPLLQPRSCAKQPPGSNPSWRKAGGHVSGDPSRTLSMTKGVFLAAFAMLGFRLSSRTQSSYVDAIVLLIGNNLDLVFTLGNSTRGSNGSLGVKVTWNVDRGPIVT